MNGHDNLCPECNGGGYLAYYGPNEGDRTELRHAELCTSCDGTGTIDAIPTEEEVGRPERWRSDEYEKWLDSL